MFKTARLLVAAAPVAAAVACAATTLSHFDGHPFQRAGPLRRIGQGWVAVDSCAQGIHALVELEVGQDTRRAVRNMVDDIGLALGTGAVHRPTHLEIAGPFCSSRPSDTAAAHEPVRDGAALSGHDPAGACATIYIVRAEFHLRHLPRDGQVLAILQGDSRTAVTWTRR